MKWSFEAKVKVVGLFFVGATVICVGRLYFLQIVHGQTYRQKVDDQALSAGGTVFDRGAIYFENKDKTLLAAAAIKSGYTISIKPALVTDPEKTYKELSFLVDIDKSDFTAKAAKRSDPYEELLKKVPEDVGKKIEALNLPGVLVIREQWRIYPADTLASHVVGFVGYDGDKIDGRYGLERYYEDNLKRDGNAVQQNFFAEIFSDAQKISRGGSTLAADLVATIEPSVERTLEDSLKEVNEKWGSKLTGGIVMDPTTGEIFAAAAYPTFNPNLYQTEKDIAVFSNPSVERVYEMGSIMKPITMAAALDTDTITASTTYNDRGFLAVGNRTIYNFDKKGRGVVSMQEVLNQSLNTGAATVALKLGKKTFTDYITAFGLGEETGIDLPSEAGGMIKNLLNGKEVELANAAFGQGIAVTPIEMIRALSALGNGGLLPSPHIIKRFNYALGYSKNVVSTENEMRRVIKKETSEEITRMLVEVVDKALKGGTVKMAHYSIAAKTGTAQIANKESGGYYEGRYFHSFFGYFPAYNPRFIIFLYTLEPKADYASNTLTAPFINMVKFLINYYQISPDR
jgi:cell division protein FtsI/penicillin-binding protein 2